MGLTPMSLFLACALVVRNLAAADPPVAFVRSTGTCWRYLTSTKNSQSITSSGYLGYLSGLSITGSASRLRAGLISRHRC